MNEHKFVVILPTPEAADYFSHGIAEVFKRWLPDKTRIKRRGDRVLVAIDKETISLPKQPPPPTPAPQCVTCGVSMVKKETEAPVADLNVCDCEDFYFEPGIHHPSCTESPEYQTPKPIQSISWVCEQCGTKKPVE